MPMTRSLSPRRAGESEMSCGVFWAREGEVLVKFTQGDIRYTPASGAGRGAFIMRGGDACGDSESVKGRGWRRRESNPRTRFPPAESPMMWMLLGCVPVEMRWSSVVQAWWSWVGWVDSG
jgi:hypothetical protein